MQKQVLSHLPRGRQLGPVKTLELAHAGHPKLTALVPPPGLRGAGRLGPDSLVGSCDGDNEPRIVGLRAHHAGRAVLGGPGAGIAGPLGSAALGLSYTLGMDADATGLT